MNKAVGVIGAAGIGAGLMYLFDPDRGKGRRAKVRDKAIHFKRVATDYAARTQRDLRNHAAGVIAETRSLFQCEEVSDTVLEARVRSKLGRVVSHPHAVQVKVTDGVVALSGPILAHEAPGLCETVGSMNGVKNVENLLETHEDAVNVPALQNGGHHLREHAGPFDITWSPATRLVAGIAGGVGLCVLARALTNVKDTEAIGLDADVPVQAQATPMATSPVM